MFKRVFGLLVLGFSLLQAYDGNKAAEYAQKYVKPGCGYSACPKYWNKSYTMYLDPGYYKGQIPYGIVSYSGTDCTNFVSQALEAGGMKYDVTEGDDSWWEDNEDFWFSLKSSRKPGDISDTGDSVSWIRVETLRDRFLDGYAKGRRITKSEARPGDIAFLKNGSRYFHSVMITKKTSGQRYYSAHQSDRLNENTRTINSYNPEYWRPYSRRDAQRISLNREYSGYLSSYSDISTNRNNCYAKTYQFRLNKRTKVRINLDTPRSSLDTYLYLMKNGVTIEHDDDGGSGTDSEIEETLAAGTYEVEVTTFGEKTSGSYTLKVSTIGDSQNNYERIYLGSEIDGYLDTSSPLSRFKSGSRRGYAKTYQFSLTRTTTVKIRSDMSRSMDSYIYLLDENGRKIVEDDDSGGNRDSYLVKRLSRGTYLIEVTTYREGKTGPFTISLDN